MNRLALLAVALGCARNAPRRVEAVEVQVLAHDTTWSATVAGRPAQREIHLPLGAAVDLVLSSRDYISLFDLPGLGLRDFAAPGLPARLAFRADRTGSFELRGDELCGRPHTDKTRGRIVVEDAADYLSWKASE